MSSAGRGSGKGRGSGITDDDAAVWEHTARLLKPLRKSKPRVHPGMPEDQPAVVFQASPGPGSQGADTASARLRGAQGAAGRAPGASGGKEPKRGAPELQPFDNKQARRLKSGRARVEARIDLHGMKQAEAHANLRRFLLACHADGLRTVLVITGKGGPVADSEHGGRWPDGRERGVLRRNVPIWLAEPDLRRIIVSFTSASARHGGEGAIYVHLRSVSRAGAGP